MILQDKLIPVVVPPDGTEGVSTDVSIRVAYDCEIEPASITANNFLIVVKTSNTESLYPNGISTVIECSLSEERTPIDTDDYGAANSRNVYKSTIVIKPKVVLPSNANISVVLGNEIFERTVFSPLKIGGLGDGILYSKGIYKGTIPDSYLITIITDGNKTSATYKWKRASDNLQGSIILAQATYYEIKDQVQIKFGDGIFKAGEIYTINVLPILKYPEILTWGFATAGTTYSQPVSGPSTEVPPTGGTIAETTSLVVISITPEYATSAVDLPSVGRITLDTVVFSTKKKTSLYNGYLIEYSALDPLETTETLPIANITDTYPLAHTRTYLYVAKIMDGATEIKELVYNTDYVVAADVFTFISNSYTQTILNTHSLEISYSYAGTTAEYVELPRISLPINPPVPSESSRVIYIYIYEGLTTSGLVSSIFNTYSDSAVDEVQHLTSVSISPASLVKAGTKGRIVDGANPVLINIEFNEALQDPQDIYRYIKLSTRNIITNERQDLFYDYLIQGNKVILNILE